MAIQAAVAAFRHAEDNPSASALEFEQRRALLNLYWDYYLNRSFDSLRRWESYRANYTLYRNIRSIYNPTRRLVNFYVSQVYPGVLSEDASQLPDGVQIAIPLSKDTDEKLKLCIAQFWQWSNWQINNKTMVRFGAATGVSLVQIIDDTERGKVYGEVVWPGDVKDLELDAMGNIKSYSIERSTEDEKGDRFTYRKEVDKEEFRYFRDDKQYDSDVNPYGFVPAVWVKHIDEGMDWGAPAISGSISKIDEVNGLASHTHDHVDRSIESPGLISSDGKVGRIGQEERKLKASDEYAAVEATRVKNARVLVVKGPADAKWTSMASGLDPEKVLPIIKEQLAELERDFPELSMYHKLREMSTVTGPGAARMMGDVGGRVQEVAANYDLASIRLFQMQAAIGGMRLREGRRGWMRPTEQQRKYGGFDLTSYEKGQLSMAIMPRPLVPMTESETLELSGKRLENAGKAAEIGYNADAVLEMSGITDEEKRAAMLKARSGFDSTLDNEQ